MNRAHPLVFCCFKAAVKVIKSQEKYTEAADYEIDILRTIRRKDADRESFCIHLMDEFMFRRHVCLVFPVLGKSVYDFLETNAFEPFPLEQVMFMGCQLVLALKFLKSIGLTHADLKPENLLLVSDESDPCPSCKDQSKVVRRLRRADVRVIDFGSATFHDQHHTRVVCTRHYRPPEVILDLGWSYPCDMWSVGCILFELYVGDMLFSTRDNVEHLAMMERILGCMPPDMARATPKQKYLRHGRLNWPALAESASSATEVERCRPLAEYVPLAFRHDRHHTEFLALLKSMLEWDDRRRPTPSEVLSRDIWSSFADCRTLLARFARR
jgi:serine/threonine protein kinase